MARQTRIGVIGIETSVTPSGASASRTAFTTDGGALADTPNTERVQIGRDLRVAGLKRGEVGGVRHCVVVESANQRLAVAPVNNRLHESLTDALCRPAM